jgi:hypothetical protein
MLFVPLGGSVACLQNNIKHGQGVESSQLELVVQTRLLVKGQSGLEIFGVLSRIDSHTSISVIR